MAITIAIANQKGGIGKTTLSTTLADALTRCNFKTLLIDLDPSENSTSYMGGVIDGENTIYNVLNGDCTIREAIQKVALGEIIPGDELISGEATKYQTTIGGESLLKEAIEEIQDDYDYIIIDTPPSIGIFLIQALTAANEVIVPIKAEKFALDGFGKLIKTIEKVKAYYNSGLHILGTVLIAYDSRNDLDKQVKNELPNYGRVYNFNVFNTCIRVNQYIKKSQKDNSSIFELSQKNNAVKDYFDLIKEMLEKIEEVGA